MSDDIRAAAERLREDVRNANGARLAYVFIENVELLLASHPADDLLPIERTVLEAQPDLGAESEGKCLRSWLETFEKKVEEGVGHTLSLIALKALTHVLIAARVRERRLKELEYPADDAEGVTCPFCGDSDFDLIGLKSHLTYDCVAYDDTDTTLRVFI